MSSYETTTTENKNACHVLKGRPWRSQFKNFRHSIRIRYEFERYEYLNLDEFNHFISLFEKKYTFQLKLTQQMLRISIVGSGILTVHILNWIRWIGAILIRIDVEWRSLLLLLLLLLLLQSTWLSIKILLLISTSVTLPIHQHTTLSLELKKAASLNARSNQTQDNYREDNEYRYAKLRVSFDPANDLIH